MDWLPCVKRQKVVMLARDGSSETQHRCTHRANMLFGTAVCPDDCAGCPLRMFTKEIRPDDFHESPADESRDFGQPVKLQNGTLIYPKTGWEPPSAPEGYARVSDDPKSPEAWIFVPLWPDCQDREMTNTVKSCGCLKITAMCASSVAATYGQKIDVAACKACPHRRPEPQIVELGTNS